MQHLSNLHYVIILDWCKLLFNWVIVKMLHNIIWQILHFITSLSLSLWALKVLACSIILNIDNILRGDFSLKKLRFNRENVSHRYFLSESA